MVPRLAARPPGLVPRIRAMLRPTLPLRAASRELPTSTWPTRNEVPTRSRSRRRAQKRRPLFAQAPAIAVLHGGCMFATPTMFATRARSHSRITVSHPQQRWQHQRLRSQRRHWLQHQPSFGHLLLCCVWGGVCGWVRAQRECQLEASYGFLLAWRPPSRRWLPSPSCPSLAQEAQQYLR